jgi:hypothetical protein
LSGTSNESLVHKLGRKSPQTTKELLNIATNHAFGEDVVGAIFDRSKGKAKWDEDAGEGNSNLSSKKRKKNKQWREGSLVATAKRKNKKVPTEGTSDHFKKMLEGPCLNHGNPVKHTLKDYGLMRKFLAGGSKKGELKKPDPNNDDAKGEDAVYPIKTTYIMIFGGTDSYTSRH